MVDISFTMVMQWLNFGALVFILYGLLFKPLVKFLDERSAAIEKEIKQAEDQNKKAEELAKSYEAKIKTVEKESEKFMEEMKRDALIERDKIVKSAEKESEAMIDAAKKEIAVEVEQVKNEIKKEFSNIALKCAEQIVAKEINESDHTKLVNEFMNSELS